jgi:hypothetical protein
MTLCSAGAKNIGVKRHRRGSSKKSCLQSNTWWCLKPRRCTHDVAVGSGTTSSTAATGTSGAGAGFFFGRKAMAARET